MFTHARSAAAAVAVLFAIAAAPAAVSAQDAPKLKVGDPAPKLTVSEWVQGDAVTEFKKDHIYVVEFWATWCGPCRQIIPHMNELSKAYKEKNAPVTFIGVNVWEDKPAAVKKFVKKMGEKMTYPVAIDEGGEEGATAKAWMEAAGQDGIPTAFVVGREGKIVWIGYPGEIDAVLEAVVAGTFNAEEFAKRQEKAEQLSEQLGEALEAGQTDKALGLVDELVKLEPGGAAEWGTVKFQLLLEAKRYKDAYDVARQLLEGPAKDQPEALNEIAWTILDGEGIEQRDYALALKIAVRANEASKGEEPAILDTLARAYFDTGNISEAVKYQRLAVEKAPRELRNELKETLERYENATQTN